MEALRAYQVECNRMKEMVKKGRSCEERIVFFSDAFATLLKDDAFIQLLAVEKSLRIPKSFHEWISSVVAP